MQKSRELNLISVQLFISLSKKFVKNISVISIEQDSSRYGIISRKAHNSNKVPA